MAASPSDEHAGDDDPGYRATPLSGTQLNDADAYVLEKEREQALRELGYRFVRWLAKEIMLHPEIVMDRIGRALAL